MYTVTYASSNDKLINVQFTDHNGARGSVTVQRNESRWWKGCIRDSFSLHPRWINIDPSFTSDQALDYIIATLKGTEAPQ